MCGKRNPGGHNQAGHGKNKWGIAAGGEGQIAAKDFEPGRLDADVHADMVEQTGSIPSQPSGS